MSNPQEQIPALLLADSFNWKFRPITFETPRALLPVVNVPLISYTIEFLASNGISQIFVFCSSHASQVRDYLKSSNRWNHADLSVDPITQVAILKQSKKNTKVKHNVQVVTVIRKNCSTMGQALREMQSYNIIKSDFLLISGDVIANMNLRPVLQAHKKRQLEDKRNILTIVCKQASPDHSTRSLEDDLVLALEPKENQLLHYENEPHESNTTLDINLLLLNPSLQLRYDLMDCHIAIFTQSALQTFTANADYMDVYSDMIPGTLKDEILGYKIHVHVIDSDYAARVKCQRTYDSVSKDIIKRWTYPLVVENKGFLAPDLNYTRYRNNIYRETNVVIDRTAIINSSCVIGSNTKIGARVELTRCVIGRNVTIGDGVQIHNAYIWNNCQIQSGCKISASIICQNVTIGKNSIVSKGCLLGSGVKIGPNFTLPKYSKRTLHQVAKEDQDSGWDDSTDSDHEDEKSFDPKHVGVGGEGFLWTSGENEIDLVKINTVQGHLPPRHTQDIYKGLNMEETSTAVLEGFLSKNSRFSTFSPIIYQIIRASLSNPKTDITDYKTEILAASKSCDILMAEVGDVVAEALFIIGIVNPFNQDPSNNPPGKTIPSIWNRWAGFFDFLTDPDSEINFLLNIQDLAINLSDKSQNNILVSNWHFIIGHFYQNDLLSHEAINSWYQDVSESAKGTSEDATTDAMFLSPGLEKVIEMINDQSESEGDEDESGDDNHFTSDSDS